MCLRQRILNVLAAALLLICFACAVIGTVGTQYSNTDTRNNPFPGQGNNEVGDRVYLYATRTTAVDGTSSTTYYKRDDFVCKHTFDKLTAAFVFGLVAMLISFAAALIALMGFCCTLLRWPVLVLAIVSCAALLISFALSVSVYGQEQCSNGIPSYKERDYNVDWGLIILIIGAGVAFMAACFSFSFC